MSTGNGIFTGSSTYASDFQQIIERSVAIASLPLRQLGNQKNALSSQSTELSTVESKFSALQTAIDNLVKATGAGSFGAAASDPTIAQVHIGDTSFVGDVTLEVDSLGAHTNTLSLDTLLHVTNPFTQSITTAAALTMTIGASTYAIPPGTGSLASLVEAINSSSAPVRATIINLGSGATPDYRLSLQSTNLADVAIQLNDGSQDLLSTLVSGSPATYRINGQPSVPISSDSRTVTISPGLSVDLLKTGTTDITVSRSAGSIGDALSAFVTSFNAAVDELDANRGGAGALSGQSLVGGDRAVRGVAAVAAYAHRVFRFRRHLFLKRSWSYLQQGRQTAIRSGSLHKRSPGRQCRAGFFRRSGPGRFPQAGQ